jgi:hypothetical protein
MSDYKTMVKKKTWQQFRNTGLFLFMNSILHAFGWSIMVETDDHGNVTSCYPARVKFRGFDEKSTQESYKKMGQYLKNNAEEIAEEAEEAEEVDEDDQ